MDLINRVPAEEMEYLPIRVSPAEFSVEVEWRGEVDWLGGLLDNLFENILTNFARLIRLRPFSEL